MWNRAALVEGRDCSFSLRNLRGCAFLRLALLLQLLLSPQLAQHGKHQDQVQAEVLDACLTLLEDAEPRVRLAVGECLGLLAEQRGAEVWEMSRTAILGSINRCWVSHPDLCLACPPVGWQLFFAEPYWRRQ